MESVGLNEYVDNKFDIQTNNYAFEPPNSFSNNQSANRYPNRSQEQNYNNAPIGFPKLSVSSLGIK